jgi:hypothetical protein
MEYFFFKFTVLYTNDRIVFKTPDNTTKPQSYGAQWEINASFNIKSSF